MAKEKETQELECAVKEVKREYYREYRKKNKERINENNRRYWERKALKRLQDSEGLCPKCASALESGSMKRREKRSGEKERGKGENFTSFHERLKELRTESGMSQKEFAASLNVSPSKYNKWENGVNAPDIETISSLADHFNVSVDYLFGRTS